MPDATSNDCAAVAAPAATKAPDSRDHLNPGVAAVIALFEGALAEHSFPGADWMTLSGLEEGVARARADADEARAALVRAQESLTAAERALVAEEAKLLARAHRALAYAKVFAEDAPDVASVLQTIELPPLPVSASGANFSAERMTDKPEPRRRGRPARTRPATPLFDGDAVCSVLMPSVLMPPVPSGGPENDALSALDRFEPSPVA
jgi:hypothetical protein